MATMRLPARLHLAARVVLGGLWLGVLSDAAQRALDERYYRGEDVYRTAAWNERGLFGWERALLDEHFAPHGRLVVTSCGGGREVLALLELGHEVRGFEPHALLAAFAQELLAAHGHPGSVRDSPRDRFPPDAGECDGIVVGWTAFSLIAGRAARARFLRDARARVPAGAPVLVSVFARDGEDRELRWTLRLANGLRGALGRPPVELGDAMAPNRVHVFTRERFAREAAAAGFAVADYRVVGRADDTTNSVGAVLRAG